MADDMLEAFFDFCRARQLSESVLHKVRYSSAGEALAWPALRQRIVASRQSDWQRLLEEFERGRPGGDSLEALPAPLREGVTLYMATLLAELRAAAVESQPLNERGNAFYRALGRQEETGGNAVVVVAGDPFVDFRFAEKREMELESYYEAKVAQSRAREELAGERRREAGEAAETGKAEVDEDKEILKIVGKAKAERTREGGAAARLDQDQNEYIRFFVEGRTESAPAHFDALHKRESLNAMGERGTESIAIRHKHLIYFLENSAYFRKSAQLFKHYLKPSG